MSSGKVMKFKKNKFYRKRTNHVDINFRGFLCTCNNRERECIQEAYNILNKTSETLYEKLENKELDKSEQTDISDEMLKEVVILKSENSCQRKFNYIESGAKNVLFIRTTYENPREIAEHIVKEICDTQQQQTRYLIRLTPIQTTCKAYIKDIEKAIEPLIENDFKSEAKTFAVSYNHRNNNSLNRDEVIKMIANKVLSVRNDHKVNLVDAEVSIVVEVIKGIVFIGIVPNYLKYKKYNLLSLCQKPGDSNQTTVAEVSQVINE